MSRPQAQPNSLSDGPILSSTPPSTKISFMSLPLEIRNTIYSSAIISPTPLIAWSSKSISDLIQSPIDSRFSRHTSPQTFCMASYVEHALPVEQLATRMFLVSRDVSREAAEIFYSYNTFRFVGEDWIWDTVLQWLIVQTAAACVAGGLSAWEEDAAGERIPDVEKDWLARENEREIVYPRNKHLDLPKVERGEEHELAGAVENISPKVEVVLRMLGEGGRWDRVRLSMLLPYHFVPGLQLWLSRHREYWMSMDLPNVMEICAGQELPSVSGQREVEILWKCKEEGRAFLNGRKDLEALGWEIVYVRHDNYSTMVRDWQTTFTMKRKKIEGSVEASFPSPHSHSYHQYRFLAPIGRMVENDM
ncbi:hypothetical protein EG329_011735 [Mollisiaceae sp. DMI_Dod_QoI]|nr:hypothetical protein EG329_011735 [Helotiales sp. DMI_Dod_QoI]